MKYIKLNNGQVFKTVNDEAPMPKGAKLATEADYDASNTRAVNEFNTESLNNYVRTIADLVTAGISEEAAKLLISRPEELPDVEHNHL